MKNDIKIFEQTKIRSIYDEEKDIWSVGLKTPL